MSDKLLTIKEVIDTIEKCSVDDVHGNVIFPSNGIPVHVDPLEFLSNYADNLGVNLGNYNGKPGVPHVYNVPRSGNLGQDDRYLKCDDFLSFKSAVESFVEKGQAPPYNIMAHRFHTTIVFAAKTAEIDNNGRPVNMLYQCLTPEEVKHFSKR